MRSLQAVSLGTLEPGMCGDITLRGPLPTPSSKYLPTPRPLHLQHTIRTVVQPHASHVVIPRLAYQKQQAKLSSHAVNHSSCVSFDRHPEHMPGHVAARAACLAVKARHALVSVLYERCPARLRSTSILTVQLHLHESAPGTHDRVCHEEALQKIFDRWGRGWRHVSWPGTHIYTYILST